MRTRISTIAPTATLLLALTALQCAERIPEPVAVPSVPHISWLISSQQQDRDEQTICQSDPRTECVIRVGGPDTRLLATVHLYLHPSSVDTKYVGTMRVEFLNGSAAEAHDTRIDSTVKPGGSPVNVSVTGQVTSKPGTYAVTIVLAATSTAVKKGRRDIRETVSVVVK